MPYGWTASTQSVCDSLMMLGDVGFGLAGVSVECEHRGVVRVDVSLVGKSGVSEDQIAGMVGLRPSSAWVSCDASPPTDDAPVLVCRDGDVSIASYWGSGDWDISPPPTHWMKLPQAAEETARC